MEKKKESHEIDVIALVKKVLKEWRLLLKFIAIAAIIGVIFALNTPKTYTAQVILAPEISSGGIGLSNNIADMVQSFGIDMGDKSSMDAIYPEVYPEIFSSTDFILPLFDIRVRTINDNKNRTYIQHILNDSKTPFWNYPKVWILNIFKKKTNVKYNKIDPFRLPKKDDELCNIIRSAISCQIDKKTSIINISVQDQDPLVAAIVADSLQNRLQEYIIKYRTKKANNDLAYYKKLYKESKMQYDKARLIYGSYSDYNQELVLESYKLKQEDLENEMQLKYNIYSQITNQLQMAEAKVQERTPAFTIIEKARMPYKATSAPRSLIVLMFIFIGIIFDSLWVCFLKSHINVKK